MSLLIDALKKAEQEKQEAAKRLKEAQEKAGEGIQLESRAQPQSTPVTPVVPAVESAPAAPREKNSPELRLKPLDEVADVPAAPAKPAVKKIAQSAPALKKNITIEHPEIPDTAEMEDEMDITSNQNKNFVLTSLSLDEASTEPLGEATSTVTRERLKDTISDSRLSKSVVSAADLVRDMGGSREAPTPVAAQTVFSAVAAGSGKRQAVEWIMFMGLFAVTLAAAGAFYYLKITPLTPATSSPTVAKGVEAEQAAPFVMPPAAPPVTAGAVGLTEQESRQNASISPAESTGAETAQEISVPAGEDITPAVTEPATEITASPADDAMQAAVAEPVPVQTQQPVAQEEEIRETDGEGAEATMLLEEIQVEPAAIRISRTSAINKDDALINTAYAEYNRGNFEVAQAAYQGVLDKLPDNRDALLGLAAIAQHQNNPQQAYEYYLRVLKLYPRDHVANTALININLRGNIDPVKAESLIKLMLQEQPGAAYLHFTLGNIFVAQSRWADAQQAFFDAHRYQEDNADYTYNLAVSLDHIGQAQAARDYYQRALELADVTRQVNFNTAAVLDRVNHLSGSNTN